MKNILHFLFILFLEVSSGIILSFLYWLLSYLLFKKDEFGSSRINESIYYLIILLPPFIYCYLEHLSLKRKGHKIKSVIFLMAGLTYLLAGLIFLLISTNFYLINR